MQQLPYTSTRANMELPFVCGFHVDEVSSFADKEQHWAEELVDLQQQQDQLECELEAARAVIAANNLQADSTAAVGELSGALAALEVENVCGF